LLLALLPLAAAGAELPIFDAHVHYSHDAWANLPPADAIAILRKAGLRRALVSSSGDEGTQRLVEASARARHSFAAALSHARRRQHLGARRNRHGVPRGAAAQEPLRGHRRVSISMAPMPIFRCPGA
jgi:hypothetical protein